MSGIFSLPKFPDDLDTNNELYHVFNASESPLRLDFSMSDDKIHVVPRKWEEPEIWYKGSGIINVEGELIHYAGVLTEEDPSAPNPVDPQYRFFDDPNISEELKNKYKRVIAFTDLTRGINLSSPRFHSKGEWVRGYVMAEHHNALMSAILGAENLIGIDASIDHNSIDYKLRDLSELVDEIDDEECPYGVFWYEILNTTGTTKTVQFHINIIGDYESFQFVPKQGTTPIEEDFNPVFTYGSTEEIGASLTVLKIDCCACITENNVPCEPCQFDPLLDDIPILDLPVIDSWSLPSFTCDVDCVLECPEIEPCLTPSCPTLPTWPETVVITGFPTEISITIPELTVTAPTVDVNVNVNVDWAGSTEDDGGEGACFRLIPCHSVTS